MGYSSWGCKELDTTKRLTTPPSPPMLYFKSIVSYCIIKRNGKNKTKPWTSSIEIMFHRTGTFIKSCEVMCSSWMAPLRNRKIHISSQLCLVTSGWELEIDCCGRVLTPWKLADTIPGLYFTESHLPVHQWFLSAYILQKEMNNYYLNIHFLCQYYWISKGLND